MTKAPIGYLNVGARDDFGREVRAVEVDEERARLVRWAFRVFASGDWTPSQLRQEVVARGLTTAATPRRPSRPIGKSSVHRMLTNPHYEGGVRYQGVTYAGVHEAIVPNEVWDQVQTALGTHRSAADATHVHEHYLKGAVFCGPCRRPELGRRGKEDGPGANRDQGRTLGRKFTPDPFGVSNGT
ncbi:recombinase family protein [Microbacterium sp.]|uniref:recombinase family protein n=1 Tax=Microbacterium sp. TaxID=51671 RepID=UPI003A83E221